MNKFKMESVSELLANKERLDFLLDDRKKRNKVIDICSWLVILSQSILIITFLLSWNISAIGLPLAVIAVFLCISQSFETEYQILEIVRALGEQSNGSSEQAGAGNPGKRPETARDL